MKHWLDLLVNLTSTEDVSFVLLIKGHELLLLLSIGFKIQSHDTLTRLQYNVSSV